MEIQPTNNQPIFEEPQPQQPTPIFQENQQPVQAISDNQKQVTSTLGALAYTANAKDVQQSLSQLQETWASMMDQGREPELRQTIGRTVRQRELQEVQDQQKAELSQPMMDKDNMLNLVTKQAGLQALPIDLNAIEREGVYTAQATGLQDEKQADILTQEFKKGNAQWAAENVSKMAIFNRHLDALEEENKAQGLGHKVLDMLSLPLQSPWAQHHAIPGVGGFLPSTTISRDIAELWSLPPAQFEAKLGEIETNIRHNSGVFGENLGVAIQVLQNLGRSGAPYNAFNANLWGAVDVASMPGIGKALKATGTVAGMLRATGNYRGAVDALVGDALKAKGIGGLSAGGVGPLHSPTTTVGSLIPGVSNSALVEADSALSGDVNRQITQLETSSQQALDSIRQNKERLTDAQAAEVYPKAMKQLKDAYSLENDHVLNIVDSKVTEPSRASDEFNVKQAIVRDDMEKPTPAETAKAKAKPSLSDEDRRAITDTESEGGSAPAETNDLTKTPSKPYSYTEAIAAMENEGGGLSAITNDIKVLPEPTYEFGLDDNTGLRYVSALVGDHAGDGGYQTFEEAIAGIYRRGWNPGDVDIVKIDNQYAIRVTQAVPETSVMTPGLNASELQPTWNKGVFWKNANDTIHEFFAGDVIQSTHVQSAIRERVVKPLMMKIGNLSRGSKRALAAVVELGQREENKASANGFGRWYTPNEFTTQFQRVTGRAATEKEILAYYSYKTLNDVDYAMRNKVLFTDKARRGYQTIELKKSGSELTLPRMNGRVVEAPKFDEEEIFDADTGKWSSGSANKAAEMKEKFSTGNYRVVEIESEIYDPDGNPIHWVMAPKEDIPLGQLEGHQLDYVPGGHRIYRGKWYTKQVVAGKYTASAGGRAYFRDPLTHAVHRTEGQAGAYVAKQEAARQLYNQLVDETAAANKAGTATRGGRPLTAAERQVFSDSGAGSFKRWHEMVKSGQIKSDSPFEYTYENTNPKSMTSQVPGVVRRLGSPDTPDYEKLMITRGRMYYSDKGLRLLDETGNEAPVLDPFKTIDRALNNVVKMNAFWDYNTKVVEEWTRLADQAKMLDWQNMGQNRSPQYMFTHGKLLTAQRGDAERAATYNALENLRTVHKRLLNYKTKDMAEQDMAARRFANYVEGKMGGVGDWLAGKAFDINDTNPLSALRAFTYDFTIGMANPVRLWLHTQAAAAAISVHPVYGARAATWAPIMRLINRNRSPALLDKVASWTDLHGMKQADAKQMMQEYLRSGWSSVGDDQVALDSSGILRTAASLREKGRIFMKVAEGYNRAVGWQIAWRKTMDEFPDLEPGSNEFMRKVHTATDDLTNNQTTASRAAWQTGWMSNTTQFLQYQARMLERMLPKVAGGNTRMSAEQRARLVAGQAIMYGAAGIPVAGALLSVAGDLYQKQTGQPLDQETWRVASKGMWDTIYNAITGVDSDIAARAGIGDSWDKVAEDMWNGRMQSVIQFFGGPSVEMLGTIPGAIQKAALYARSEQFGELGPEQFGEMALDLSRSMSTMSMLAKVYWADRTGYLIDQKTGAPIAPASKMDEVSLALGIPLRVEREKIDEILTEEERADLVREYAKQIADYRRNAIRALDNQDDRDYQYWANMSQGLMGSFDPLMRQEVTQEAGQVMKEFTPEHGNIISRITRRTGMKPQGEQ